MERLEEEEFAGCEQRDAAGNSGWGGLGKLWLSAGSH